ncbi:hypothetical protein SO694_0000338 [Aureococcus anophagefferens]|uniref:EF-hand domain-containing protein n=1 Tax=Aureococcus anophagefferens TaxID=44056 RepID=A0ABR1GDE8_AURAN
MADGDLAAAAAAMLKKDADDDDHVSVGSGLSSDEEDAAPRKPAGGASQSEERKRLIAEKMSRIGGAKGGSAFAPPARRRLDAPDATTSSMAAAADELRKALGGEGDDDEPPSPAKSKRSSLGSPAARASPTRDLTADTLDKAARTLLGEKTDATSEALNRAARTLSPTKELDGSRRSSPTKGLEAAARRVASPTPPDVEADLERAARALSTPDDLLEAAARKLAEEEKKRGGGTDDDDVAAAAVALAEAEPDAPRVVSWAAGDVVDAKFRGAWAPATVLGAAKESSKKGAGYDVRYDDGGVVERNGPRTRDQLLAAFKDADADGSGVVDRGEFRALLEDAGLVVDETRATAALGGDGDAGEHAGVEKLAAEVQRRVKAAGAGCALTVRRSSPGPSTAASRRAFGKAASAPTLRAAARPTRTSSPSRSRTRRATATPSSPSSPTPPPRRSGGWRAGRARSRRRAWDRLRKAARADAKKATLDASALKKHLGTLKLPLYAPGFGVGGEQDKTGNPDAAPSPGQAAAVVRRCLDPSGDGAVTLAEFAAFAFWPPRPAPDVKRAELVDGLGKLGCGLLPDEQRALVDALDGGGDGVTGLGELQAFLGEPVDEPSARARGARGAPRADDGGGCSRVALEARPARGAEDAAELRLRLRRAGDREAGLLRAWRAALARETEAKAAAKRAELDAQAKLREARKMLGAALRRTQECERLLDADAAKPADRPPPPPKTGRKRGVAGSGSSKIDVWHFGGEAT